MKTLLSWAWIILWENMVLVLCWGLVTALYWMLAMKDGGIGHYLIALGFTVLGPLELHDILVRWRLADTLLARVPPEMHRVMMDAAVHGELNMTAEVTHGGHRT